MFFFSESEESGIDREGKKVPSCCPRRSSEGPGARQHQLHRPCPSRGFEKARVVGEVGGSLDCGIHADNSKAEGEEGRLRPEARGGGSEIRRCSSWLTLAGGGLDPRVSKKIQNSTHSACSIILVFGSMLMSVNIHKHDVKSRTLNR